MKNPHDEKQTEKVLLLLLLFPVIWAALLAAPFSSEGLSGIIQGFTDGMNHPFDIQWCEDSLKTIFIFVVCYGLGVGFHFHRNLEHTAVVFLHAFFQYRGQKRRFLQLGHDGKSAGMVRQQQRPAQDRHENPK